MMNILLSQNNPLWLSILAPVITFFMVSTGILLISGRIGKANALGKIPTLLKRLNQRKYELALKESKKMEGRDYPLLSKDLMETFKLKQYENQIRSKTKLHKRTEEALMKKISKKIKTDIPQFVLSLEAMAYRSGISLEERANKDITFTFYKEQLFSMIIPTPEIQRDVDQYLDYSNGFNTLLMLVEWGKKDIREKLSTEAVIAIYTYNRHLEKTMAELVSRIKEKIENYIATKTGEKWKK